MDNENFEKLTDTLSERDTSEASPSAFDYQAPTVEAPAPPTVTDMPGVEDIPGVGKTTLAVSVSRALVSSRCSNLFSSRCSSRSSSRCSSLFSNLFSSRYRHRA